MRTRAFRSFDEQVGRHVFPVASAAKAVDYYEEQLGQPLSETEQLEVFWTAVRTAPDLSVIVDPRSVLRASIRAFERTRDLLAAAGRRLVLLRSAEPLLVLADSGIALRRKDGTFGLTPPLLPETIEVFVPLSPTCLLISTTRAHHRPREGLTRKIAAKANAGAAAWCQDAVYRPPSIPWSTHLQLADTPLQVSRHGCLPYPSSPPRDPPQRAARHPGTAPRCPFGPACSRC
ncbi:hypothetical protein [Streptomyces galilaeus]|uniref:hypothetical protein n=1 Tax=Streptomyces galilaeus TaxID=33899 RepID=UPI00167C262D|nr:hypothetical protein [Streptomyces galilaeus]GGW78431.1 hypothetical protein GCM10010350_74210 [Streptomyces galilaeus]